jgi:hypothetical protein
MAKNTGSRVLFAILVAPCALLCLLSVISFASFAAMHNEIIGKLDHEKDYCVLFNKDGGTTTDDDGNDVVILKSDGNGPCLLVIWGEVTVCFASILLGVLFVVKALIGLKA